MNQIKENSGGFFTEDESLIGWLQAGRQYTERWPETDIYIFIGKTAPSSTRITFPPVCVMNSSPIRPKERVLWIHVIQPSPGIKSGVLHMISKKCWKKVPQDNFSLWGKILKIRKIFKIHNFKILSMWLRSLLLFKTTYQENKHILTLVLPYQFSSYFGKFHIIKV